MNEQQLAHIHLFGNPEENFYSLGRRDKIGHAQMYEQISKLCARSQHMVKVLKIITEISDKMKNKNSHPFHKELIAYADGLERPIDDVYFMLLLPEIVASFNKWLPHLLGIIPGCSSLFVQNPQTKGIVHGRILDYAVAGPFEKFERCITYEFKNRLKCFTYSTVGMPFPGLTTINEKGLTLAVHYKHGDYFDTDGNSIFAIIYQLASYCTNVQEVKKYLKNHPSIGYWGIYVSDTNGQVASFDIRGAEVYQQKFDISEHKYIYFNNRPLIKNVEGEDLQPFGNLDQCLMRKQFIKDKMSKFNFESKNINFEVLKTLTHIKSKKKEHAKDWLLPSITPSSIQAITFDNKDFKSLFIPGSAPKLFKGEYLEFKDVFSHSSQELKKKKIKTSENFNQGQTHWASAQSDMDNDYAQGAYHHLQMAIEYFEGYPEKYIAQFFFIIWQYIQEDSTKDLSYLYQQLIELEDKLPPYLNDHRLLFILRLNKLLGYGVDQDLKQKIKNKNLRIIFNKEEKMRPMAIKFLRKFTIPRLEILDIIYMYA